VDTDVSEDRVASTEEGVAYRHYSPQNNTSYSKFLKKKKELKQVNLL
jgi:hypothetical protein